MKFTSSLLFLFAIGSTTINASKSDCYLKYSGNLTISNTEDNKVGVAGPNGFLGKVDQKASSGHQWKGVGFSFYECKINKFYVDPEEHGFLIANDQDSTYCSTANILKTKTNYAFIDHETCNYDANNLDLINRQLVYANYYNPGDGAVIEIFFQGSPEIETNTGFALRNAFFAPLGVDYAQFGELILSDETTSLRYPRLQLTNVVIERDSSINSGKRTKNEERIVKSLQTGQTVNLANSVKQTYDSKKTIF